MSLRKSISIVFSLARKIDFIIARISKQ
ncbi:hypothetical protein YPPY02_1582, partial [Yersinia pestis PY-02]